MPKNGRPRKTLAAIVGLAVVGAGVAGGTICSDDRCRDQAETARTLDGLGVIVRAVATTNSTSASAAPEVFASWDTRPGQVAAYQSGQTIDGWTPSLVASSSA